MNKYSNLQELVKYHPYSECTVCNYAQIEPELLQAVLNGAEVLTPIEIIRIARLYKCPAGVIEHPEVIMLDMGRWRHRKMVAEVDYIYIRLKCIARNGYQETEKYLKWADLAQQKFMYAAYENRLSYGHYFGAKERLAQYVSFAAPKPKKRGFILMEGGAV